MRGLVEIEIGGQKRPLKFGTNASAILGQELGLSYEALQQRFGGDGLKDVSLMDMRAFIWAALVAGHQSKRIEVDFDITDVGDWLDETDIKTLDAAFKANQENLPLKKKGAKGHRKVA